MTTTAIISVNSKKITKPTTENLKKAESHKNTADHLLAAAAHHFKAAYYVENGEHEKAEQSALLAGEYLNLANAATKGNITHTDNSH
ncbi:MAG: hypothetical protein ACLQQ4_06790 [Bacteroidia bacterium]